MIEEFLSYRSEKTVKFIIAVSIIPINTVNSKVLTSFCKAEIKNFKMSFFISNF
jgi:hypothetical protein